MLTSFEFSGKRTTARENEQILVKYGVNIRSRHCNNTQKQQSIMSEESSSILQQIAGALGATGVGLGAIGAHALRKKLEQRGMTAAWNTAILYQLFHSAALVGVAALAKGSAHEKQLTRAGQVMAVGSLLFSGSIYMLCFEIGPKYIVGPTTPIGGFFMIGGWIMLGLAV
jgi:uncharacterized membrane protein YgdD (TMEM256/DUF423 family)